MSKMAPGKKFENWYKVCIRFGVRVKGQSRDGMEVPQHNIQFKSFANGFAILLQTFLPQSRRLACF
jgi:hypothetical protein